MSTRVKVVVLNATFNNISVISWRSVLLVEEAGVRGENAYKLDHIMYQVHPTRSENQTHSFSGYRH